MYYNGKELNLRAFIEERKKSYIGKPDWTWEDEGLVFAIMDYYGMCDFTAEDIECIKENGFTIEDIISLCEE